MLKQLVRRNSKKEAKIHPYNEYTLNFDGASKGNPGLSGAGMVIYKNGYEIWSSYKFVGYKTNNQAEYSALIFGLKGAIKLGISSLSVLGDSLLVINQVNGIFKVKSASLEPLHKEVIILKDQFKYIDFSHVYREYNKRADELSNLALDNPSNVDTELDIQNLDEDWDEEIKIDDLIQKKNTSLEPLPVQVPVPVAVPILTKAIKIPSVKQTSITQFFKMDPLFPEI